MSSETTANPWVTGAEPAGMTYCLYAAFAGDRGDRRLESGNRAAAAAEALTLIESIDGVHLRGAYSLVGFRAEADIMFWILGDTADALQEVSAKLSHSDLGRSLTPYWTNIGVHREAEFNKGHVPAYFAGEDTHKYLCVYPFVRSLEWYLLDPKERRDLLMEHGIMGRDYPDVRANTNSAFALGDYEWLLAFEADELERIVDLMRHLRGSETRRHVREEVPFYTGRRRTPTELLTALP